MDNLIDPSKQGEKTIPINFSNLDFEDPSGVPSSFKACKTALDICDWYEERLSNFPPELLPYLTFKTVYPGKDMPTRTKKGFFTQKGHFVLSFA